MNDLLNSIFTANFLFTVIRVSTPLILASLGAVISSKAGVGNIGIEGTMLVSALSGVLGSAYSNNIWIGFLAAMIAGLLSSLFIAYFTLNLKTDLVLTCIAFNIMAAGGTIYFMYSLTGDKGNTIALQSGVLPSLEIPLISNIPFIGTILSGHNILSYVAILMIFVVWLLLNKTPLGLRIKSAGESPDALESVGVSVNKIRYIALLISGLLAGIAGAFMSMGYVSWFSRDMVGGRGFIALAADAMGNSTPIGAALSSVVFGIAEAISYPLQTSNIPTEIVQMVPYVATIIGLVIYSISNERKIKYIKRETVKEESLSTE